ncbi:MAG: hypothetical protein HGA67_03115 [Candidatus Yonathbacteria bacterium]|nr:hypothetical protein [Candidatus Yonathbacteria bacterium]
MVKKVFSFINKEFAGLHQAAYLLAGFALLSQVLGLLRDRLLAHIFGAGAMLDVYYAAFRIPDLIFIGVSSFVSLTVLIPFLAERIGQDGETTKEAKEFIDSITTIFLGAVLFSSVAVFIAMPILARILTPGFTAEQMSMLVLFSRLLLLSPILLGISNILGGITQTFHKFTVYAAAPVMYNAGIVFGIIFLLPTYGLFGVTLGVVIGALLHVAIQIPVVYKHGLVPGVSFHPDWSAARRVVGLSLPRTIALSAGQIVSIVLVGMASTVASGSVSIMSLAFNLQSVPLSVIGVSYSMAAFPTLARFFSNGDDKKFAEHMMLAARHIILWSLPAIVLFIVLRAQIVRVILGSGGFSWTDTRLTAAVLALFSVSLAAQSLRFLFVRGYYAAGKTQTPLIINIISSAGIIALIYILTPLFSATEGWGGTLVTLLKINELPGTGVIVLPLAYSIGMIADAVALWWFFDRDFYAFSLRAERAFIEVGGASLVMGVVAYYLLGIIAPFINMDTFMGVFLQGFGAGMGGIVAGIVALILIGNKEVKEISGALRARVGRVSPIPAEKEEI